MNEQKICHIEADHTTTVQYPDEDGSENGEHDPSELPESLYAQYMESLIAQMQLCWEVIRNREAKEMVEK
jgi:hypothetical protein